jgi:hypothetical protein
MFKITTYDDDTLYIDDQGAESVMKAMKAQSKFVQINGQVIAVSNIASILEENRIRNKTNIGKLHDGSLVRRVFGIWRDFNDSEIMIDPTYYPEVAIDCVPTAEDWEVFIRPLPLEERLNGMKKLMGITEEGISRLREYNKGFSSIAESIKQLK